MELKASTIEFHNSIANEYDALFSASGTGNWMRRRVQEQLLDIFKPGQRILEINCGTGTDAIVLGKAGIRVHATDISPRMVQMTAEKVVSEGLTTLVTTDVMDADDPSILASPLFDGAFSNFNGLNHVDDLERTMHRLSNLLKPGGRVLCVLLNPFCLWEVLYLITTLQLPKAWRRAFRRGEELVKERVPMNFRLYSPRQFSRIVNRDFLVRRVSGLGIFLPPAGFPRLYVSHVPLLRRLDVVERILSSLYPFFLIGDHFMVELEKRK
ncbi:MAG TPA: class I SAM-dependent methyltransferase [Bacteroidota bacterium]|nr:class I SAM-dependent methyltransferase [Bacteroidota bacterium]